MHSKLMLSQVAHLRKTLVALTAIERSRLDMLSKVVSYITTLLEYHMTIII